VGCSSGGLQSCEGICAKIKEFIKISEGQTASILNNENRLKDMTSYLEKKFGEHQEVYLLIVNFLSK